MSHRGWGSIEEKSNGEMENLPPVQLHYSPWQGVIISLKYTQQDYYDSQYGTLLHSYCTGTYTLYRSSSAASLK